MGVAKEVIKQLVNNHKSLNLTKKYYKVVASALPENTCVLKLFKSLNFNSLGYNGEYVVLEKDAIKTDEKVK